MAALVSSVSLAVLAARLAPRRAWVMARWSIRGPLVVAATAAFSAGGGSGEEVRRHLVLYKKPGCCLCDGLEEKLHAALSLAGGPHSLPSVDLQVRDITGNPEWEMLYQYEIPVLAKVLPDGTEVRISYCFSLFYVCAYLNSPLVIDYEAIRFLFCECSVY
ncbi:unnamed protein product [Musa textilis]